MTSAARRARPLLAAAVAAVFLLPLAFMLLGSLRTPGLPPPDGFEVLPDPVRWENYRSVFEFVASQELPRWVGNSLLVVAVAVPLTVLVASWAGFATATASRRIQRVLVMISLVALMVPLSALWVPRFVLFRWLGTIDTLVPLVAPALMATTPFYVLVFAWVYSRVPRELYEAATLEGLRPLQIWRRVAWPLGRPATFAVAVLAFIWHWANFVDPLLYLQTEDLYTVPLGLRSLHSLEPTNYPILLAAAVLVTLPAVVAFLAAHRAFLVKTVEAR